MPKSSAKPTTAGNLESKFDEGEDVLDYFDLKTAKKTPPSGPITAFRLSGNYDFGASMSCPGVLRSSQILASQVATIRQGEHIREVLSAADTYGGEAERCFIPRFGLTVGCDATAIDVLICVDCGWVYFFEGDKKIASKTLSEKGRECLVGLYLELFPGRNPGRSQVKSNLHSAPNLTVR